MERAIGIMGIDKVLALRRAAVTLSQLWANWVATKGNRVGAEQDAVRIREKFVLRFLYDQ